MRQRGFTLVEVLVALLIMAIMAAMGWQGVSSMARARDIGSATSERALRLGTLVAQWEQDLQATYDSPLVPGLSFDGSAMRIVRRSDDGVQVVVWSLREGNWQRWASPAARHAGELQQAWLVSQQLQGAETGQLKLLDGVTEWQVYFWRGQGWSNAQSSGDVRITATATPAQEAASTPDNSASGVAAGAASGAGTAVTVQSQSRTLLPTGVRLQIDLPEGRLLRDVMLAPQS